MLATAAVTCGRKAPRSAIDSEVKKRRRSTSATSCFCTGWTPSSLCRLKMSKICWVNALPNVSLFAGSDASREATRAQRSTLTTAWQRDWKKPISRPRQSPAIAAFSRAYISTSSIRTRVARPSACGRDSRSASSGSAGGVSRSSFARSGWSARKPSSPAIWNASTLQGCFSQRSSPAGSRTSMPFSTSSLSKQSAAMRAAGRGVPMWDLNWSTADRAGNASGSWTRWRNATSVWVLPPP